MKKAESGNSYPFIYQALAEQQALQTIAFNELNKAPKSPYRHLDQLLNDFPCEKIYDLPSTSYPALEKLLQEPPPSNKRHSFPEPLPHKKKKPSLLKRAASFSDLAVKFFKKHVKHASGEESTIRSKIKKSVGR